VTPGREPLGPVSEETAAVHLEVRAAMIELGLPRDSALGVLTLIELRRLVAALERWAFITPGVVSTEAERPTPQLLPDPAPRSDPAPTKRVAEPGRRK